MQIIDLTPQATAQIEQIAQLLVESFQENHPDASPDNASALAEVQDSFQENRISANGKGKPDIYLAKSVTAS